MRVMVRILFSTIVYILSGELIKCFMTRFFLSMRQSPELRVPAQTLVPVSLAITHMVWSGIFKIPAACG